MVAILFDLDGVLYESDTAIDGAAKTIRWFDDNQIPHLFLTNTTSKSRAELVTKLARFNIRANPDNFLTPPVSASQWLRNQNIINIALYVPEATKEEFSEFNICNENEDIVDAIVIGDLGLQWTFEIMNRIFRLLIDNPQSALLALGMTRYWRSNSGLQLDVGPMIKAFEYATDRSAIVTGKPAKEFFQSAISLLGEQNEIIMIGDDIRSDIEASQQAGLKAIQVRTGKFTDHDLRIGIRPDAIIDSIAQLPGWWKENM